MSIHTHSPADTLRTQAAPIRRRSLMTLAGLGLLLPTILSACSSRSGKASSSGTGGHIDTLRVHVPTTLAYMAPMTLFGQQGKLAPTIGKATVENWSSIDAMRTLLLQKQTDLAATPSYAAANLFNKGVPLRLVAMQVWGMLYVVGPKGSSAQGLQAMRGKTVAVPMPNNMPDLVFRYLLGQKGWDTSKDLAIQNYADGQEALSNLLAGNAEFAVLPEHAASAGLAKAKQQSKTLERTADLQQVWAEVTGGEAKFPMAGLVMPQEITDSNPQAVGAVLNEVEACIAATNAMSEETVNTISQKTEVPAPVRHRGDPPPPAEPGSGGPGQGPARRLLHPSVHSQPRHRRRQNAGRRLLPERPAVSPHRSSAFRRWRARLLWWAGIGLAILIWYWAALDQPEYALPARGRPGTPSWG